MSIFKCKMCGGTVEFKPGASVGVCDSCGTKQTLPRLDDDRRANLYDRANHFRRNNEFDKAAGIYEQILTEDTADAEAYWSLVLCRYGIEYVEDPATKKRVPTVNRAQFTSIFDDDNYKSAIQYADVSQRAIYEEEANAINEIQKGILAISQKEEPFDVFICYKETDANGRRTPDSVLANDLYHQLTQEGFKVFFSRITLEDKLGTAYEPYIFAALNSAKVMVVLGTKPEHFSAVWVKNEWSRYLALVKQSGGKKILIPAYKDMDPYDLPEEFSHLQAQDMSKLGFMQDLIRGIKKIVKTDEPKPAVVKETVPVASGGANVAPLLKRAFMFLEDGDWARADEFCEQALNLEPENAEAYLGKLMAEMHVKTRRGLADCEQPFDGSGNYQKTMRFGTDALKKELTGYIEHVNELSETARKTGIYDKAVAAMNSANSESAYKSAATTFKTIPGFKDANALAEKCLIIAEKAAKKRKKIIAIMAPILIACIAFLIVLTTVIIPSARYNNSVEKYGKEWVDLVRNADVGDVIKLGKYEQDNNITNGQEEIEWIILKQDGVSLLLISKYALDCQQYNTFYTDVTWETCSLRKWLNGTFISNAFTSDEQNMIQSITVKADKNPSFNTSPGNNTTDKVFLLSITEANNYFSSNEARKCVPTDYTVAQGVFMRSAYLLDGKATCSWLLRSPGEDSSHSTEVHQQGSIISGGSSVNYDGCAVRPALWISLD